MCTSSYSCSQRKHGGANNMESLKSHFQNPNLIQKRRMQKTTAWRDAPARTSRCSAVHLIARIQPSFARPPPMQSDDDLLARQHKSVNDVPRTESTTPVDAAHDEYVHATTAPELTSAMEDQMSEDPVAASSAPEPVRKRFDNICPHIP